MAQTGWCWSRKFIVTIQLRDLTNVQFPIPNVHPMGRRLRILCRLLPPRMRIEHCELSIGQIYQNVLNSYAANGSHSEFLHLRRSEVSSPPARQPLATDQLRH